jgi:hypothetical protein
VEKDINEKPLAGRINLEKGLKEGTNDKWGYSEKYRLVRKE